MSYQNQAASGLNNHIQDFEYGTSWTALQYFNIYRILLVCIFVILIHSGQLPQPLGILDASLFSWVSHLYLIISISFAVFIANRFPRLNLQIAIHALIDIVMLSLMMYASNGLGSGFGMLLVIAVAGGSILRAGKISILFAAIATLAVLGHELYIQFFVFFRNVNYIHAGILGATFFIAAIIGNFLSARVKASEALAEQRAKQLGDLAKLNEYIVQRMQSGILVLDDQLKVLLLNESAKRSLLISTIDVNEINQIILDIFEPYINEWLENLVDSSFIIKPEEQYPELAASFIKLTYGESYQILIFLEDTADLRQRAQQLKLASLGRLAASIAHEVRNPLGAINHAGQLLKESSRLNEEDKRLTEIINDHSLRVNSIIENVLSISRRDHPATEQFELNAWLSNFLREFSSRYELTDRLIEHNNAKKNIQIKFDPSQFHQVLWNLCENAYRYSKGEKVFTLNADIDPDSERPYLDVIDYGSGMSESIQEQLFEPFFTTEAKGSGLGLYLAKELCETNQARLQLMSSTDSGTTFRVNFTHIDKKSIY